jgi:hypothetical protein
MVRRKVFVVQSSPKFTSAAIDAMAEAGGCAREG